MLEFQKHSQTAAVRGEAELRTLNFKTIWSECQRVSQTTAARGEAKLRILDMVRVPEDKSNFCCTWQRWAAYHPKSDSKRWVELKWTRIKLELVQNIPFSHPRREEMKIIEVSS